ncbi:MAG: alanine racemase [Legionellales bacterium]|jgi:alanine racemase
MTTPIAQINLGALHHNFSVVKQYAPKSKVLVVLKANGYGHGIVRIAKTLLEADAFGVSRVDEALMLREAGVTHPIVAMTGFSDLEELKACAQFDIQVVIHSDYQIDYLEQTTLAKPITVWFKIETGLGRLGFPVDKIQLAYQRLMACSQITKPMTTLSHLASADNVSNPKTSQQLARFQKITATFEGPQSLARSAAIFSNPDTHLDWVRPGLMLYGASPFPNEVGIDRGLQAVMTMKSQLISINHIPKGETVGYGETWKCEEGMPVGVVGFGYADGYPRNMTQGTPVLINGVRCPLIGRVSMDMITVDLRACPHAKIGDVAILWGPELPIEIIARGAHTTPYNLWVNISSRVKFIEK